MGADQNLIRAASRMGEKPWDYSGIMKAIQAIGAYTAQKRAIANELTSYGANITNIKAVPNEVFNGDYGDQNMDFMTGAKQEWNNATNIIKNPMVLPSSKKYKQAVKTINNIKSVLENNKAGLIKWEEIRKGIQNKRAKMSKGTAFYAENRILDIVNNEADANINNNLIFTNKGLMYYDSKLDEMVDMANLTNGYKENFIDDTLTKRIDGIIAKYGTTSKEAGDEFQVGEVTSAFKGVFNDLKIQSFDHLRSLAYDYQWGGTASFVEDQSDRLLQLTNKEWYEQNPDATRDEIAVMKEQTLASVFGANNQQTLEGEMLDWFVNKTREKHSAASVKKGEQGKIQLGLVGRDNTSLYMDLREKQGAIAGIEGKRSFFIDNTEFTWDNKNEQWIYNSYGGAKAVEGDSQGMFKDGSSEALLFQFKNDPDIAQALGIGMLYGKKQEDETEEIEVKSETTLPTLNVDSTQVDSIQS